MNDLMKEVKKHILKVLFGIIFLSVVLIFLERFNTWFFTIGPIELKNFFSNLSFLSIPIFIILYVLANVFMVPSYPFVFSSGIIYGIYLGFIVSLISELASASINFYIARRLKPILFVHKIKNKKIRLIKKYIDLHGFSLVLLSRYLGFYFDLISYASGLTKLKYKKFILATAIGFLPYLWIYVIAGNMLINLKSSSFIYFILFFKIIIFALFMIGYLIYTKIYNYKKKK